MNKHKTLDDLMPLISKCVRCSFCKFPPLAVVKSQQYSSICPSYLEYKFHSHSGGGKIYMALSLLDDRTEKISEEARDIIFQCALCGGCDMSCKFSSDIEILDGLYALRAECFKQVGPTPGQKRVLDRMKSTGSPLPESESSSKGEWAKEFGLKPDTQKDKLLFVGDRFDLQPNKRQTLFNLIELLYRGGISFSVLGKDEPSTGRAALDFGDVDQFNQHALAVATTIKNSGVKTVICVDPLDYQTMRVHLPKVADLSGIQVVHAVEVLNRLVKKRKIKPSKPIRQTMAYHDPCTLGRLSEPFSYWNGEEKKVFQQLIVYDPPRTVNRGTSGVYDPPRRLLKMIPGLNLVEFERCRERAFCCGGEGLGYNEDMMEFIQNTAAHRLSEAASVGAEVVTTACPNCLSNFESVSKDVGIEVKHIFDVLHESVKP